MSVKYHCYGDNDNPDVDYREIVAQSSKEAAEKYRAIDDQEAVEWPTESVVYVRNCRSGVIDVFNVICEATPTYYARRKP